MSSSTEDSEYEPSLRSLNTSDNSASSSDNDYFSTSEEEEGGEGRAWRSLELSEERMNAPPPRFPFTGNPGIKIDENPAELSPFEFFSLFIDKRIIDSVLVETNRFAEQTGQDDSLWRPVTEAELFVFFAMKMLGGIVKMPEEEMNWSHDELLERPIFRQLMTMERYSKIKQYLHFVDNETHDAQTHPNPKLYKIYDVFMTLCENFGKYYTPRQDVCIDESLMLFKGRLGWVQYIPLKRRRFGVKYFMLCESKTGYVYNMTIYVGKGTQFDPEYDAYPVSSRVVLSLMKPLFGKGYCVTVDNYYTSPQLADALVMNQTDTYGTLRMNRKEVPEELKRKKLKKGEVAAFQRGKVMTLRWKDKKDVAMLSTIHNPAMHDIETRQGPVKKPKVVCEYNHTMGGVDKVDQQLVDYPIPRKRGKKYYKTVFFHLMDIGVWNAFILHQEAFTQSGKKSLTHLKFRLEIIRYIFGKYGPALPPRSPGRPSTSPGSLRHTPGGHFPMEVPPTEKKKNPTRKCVVCSLKRDHRGKQVRKESRYMCKVCQVALCVVPCFEKYHSK